MRDAFVRIGRYIKELATNKFFGFGLLGLALLVFAGYYLFDKVLMPQYVRSGLTVAVPDLMEQPVEDAEVALEAINLRVEVEGSLRYNPNIPRGTVVDQNPAPMTQVKPGRRIYLTINEGVTQKVTMPNVVEYSRESAIHMIAAAGLRLNNSDIRPDSIPSPHKNTITKQYPPPGTQLDKDSRVRVWYSTGFGDAMVAMPDVVGMTVQDAQRTLLTYKLRSVVMGGAGVINIGSQPVSKQDKQPGTRLREGTEVRLFISGN